MEGPRGRELVVVGCVGCVALTLFAYMRTRKHNRRGNVVTQERFIAGEQPGGGVDTSSAEQQHPEGPNIGFLSGASWFNPDKQDPLPEKTDLLHTGHARGGKLIIATVGLPGRGKTYIARKVARYLRWINYRTRVFSLAKARLDKFGTKDPEFFDETIAEYQSQRLEVLVDTLEDVMRYLNRGGEVAIVDGTNTTRTRRDVIRQRAAAEDGFTILWIEAISEDEEVLEKNIENMQQSPDFRAVEEFQQRVAKYRKCYTTVEAEDGMFVKVYDGGRRLELHDIHGFLPTKVVSFVMNLHTIPRPVYITRHGESEFNVRGLIGGDSGLSHKGAMYARALSEYIAEQADLPSDQLQVWSSTMYRARLTAKQINCHKYVEWRALREIEVGVCDGLAYEQIKLRMPDEYRAREQDKLRYRYPRGESYLDIINRLEPVIFELERNKEPLVVVAHQAVHRCLYAYFLDLPAEEVPFLSIPLHTLIRLDPSAYGCKEKRVRILIRDEE